MSKEQTVRYSNSDLEEFRGIIEEKVQKARHELNYLREQIIELNENLGDDQGIDYMDDSSSYSELENLNYMVNRQQQFINKLENALLRIKNKTYGICTVTGELIDKERLKRVPHATKTLQAKMAPPEQSKATDSKPKPERVTKPKIKSRIIKKSGSDSKKPENSKSLENEDWEDDLDNDDESIITDELPEFDPDQLSDEDILDNE